MSEIDSVEEAPWDEPVRHDSDWEDVSDGDFEVEGDFADLPPLPADGVSSSTWHKQVIAAVAEKSASQLDTLLENAVSERICILNYAEEMIEAVGTAICQGDLSTDFKSSLEMLMFLIVEHGSAAELMICFIAFFHRDVVHDAELEFFLPNMQGTLMRLQRFRLYWLSSVLSQLDFYAANSELSEELLNGESVLRYDKLVHMQNLVCDFAQSFVEDVRITRSAFTIPPEKHFTLPQTLAKHRECLARALLHLLAAPLGAMPVSYAAGFTTSQRIVHLLGKVLPDFSVLLRWYEADHRPTDSEISSTTDETKIPISTDSIARLAFLVRCCDVMPNCFPTPLTAEYYLLAVIIPCSECHGRHELSQHLAFCNAMLDEITDGSLVEPIAAVEPVMAHIVRDLLGQAVQLPSEKSRKRIYLTVHRFFDKMSAEFFHRAVRTVWNTEESRQFPTILEVLVMAVKKRMTDHLQSPDTVRDPLQRSWYLDLFKGFLRMTEYHALADWAGLVTCVLGVFSVALGLDRTDVTGVHGILDAVEAYAAFWRNAVAENVREVQEELWKRKELERSRLPPLEGKTTTAAAMDVPVEKAADYADLSLNYTNILTLALDTLAGQIDRARAAFWATNSPPTGTTASRDSLYAESDSLTAKFKNIKHERLDSSASGSDSSSSSGSSDWDSSDSSTDTADSDGKPVDLARVKANICSAALHHVKTLGWTRDALVAGAKASGYPSVLHGLFSNGGLDLIVHCYDDFNLAFRHQLTTAERSGTIPSDLSVRERITYGIKTRLEYNKPFLSPESDAWKSAVAELMLPQNTLTGARLVGHVVDDIWYWTGDRTIGSDWYAKRAALAAVYQATELVMLTDTDPFDRTWEFLERRMDDFMQLHNAASMLHKTADQLLPFLQAATITVANLTGLNQRRTQ
ncbi:putative Ubiquinone biosynthesis protein COQ9-B, mitochondrial [Hypsibius exemplaris]|uniref:Ubiquinone biosynthesis protein n=1 Tax=Hypsibius exemplaris TaxID=2072580 RepID=A0A1W0X7R9_HYPEX|nr:putative Ubiquinone biosynthesis protein COQ9-B, mitochondrial [Hypsibius exemplaris]